MKAETKAKIQMHWQKTKRFMKEWALPIFGVATIGAAWSGHIKANRLEEELEQTKKVVDNNATVQQHDRDKLLELEHQQTLLFERALQVTEGKG